MKVGIINYPHIVHVGDVFINFIVPPLKVYIISTFASLRIDQFVLLFSCLVVLLFSCLVFLLSSCLVNGNRLHCDGNQLNNKTTKQLNNKTT